MKPTSRVMRIGRVLVAAALLSVCGMAQAQDTAPFPAPRGPDVVYGTAAATGMGFGEPDDALVFIGFEGELVGKTVTGSPFSATISTQEKQVLADGNQIQRSDAGNFARDSQGRTRRDMSVPGIGLMASANRAAPHVVMINDPVAGAQYILEVDKKIARKMRFEHEDEGERGARVRAEPDGAGPVITFRAEAETKATTESLGTQTINGVLAEGTRTTRTIPAGAIGNMKPIVITVERWYSPDLLTVVKMERNDPRMGQTTFQLTNIQRQEPDASLFQVPADYTVKQGRTHFIQRRIQKMGQPPDGEPGEPAAPPPLPEE